LIENSGKVVSEKGLESQEEGMKQAHFIKNKKIKIENLTGVIIPHIP